MIRPDGAAYAFALSIDVDGDLPLLADDPSAVDREKTRSAGRYGPDHGVARLSALLADLDLKADWFFPGLVAAEHPDVVRALHRAGHGIGVHGHRHLDFDRLTLEEQIAEMTSGRAAIERITGAPATGFRTPAGEWAAGFPEAMGALGFRWSSSLPSDELPFPLTRSGLVEVPFRYELEDKQYLAYNLDPAFPPGQSRITPLETVEENWWHEVRGAARYGTLVHLRLNAEVMGIPGRARMLRRFLSGVRARGDAWFATCDELCSVTRRHADDGRHPYALFLDLVEKRA